MRRLVLGLAILAVCPVLAASPAPALAQQTRTPAISPDGKTIFFVYMGDIWRVPAIGGDAFRLTVNPAHDTSPVVTPDGQSIVFASDRAGNINLYVMAVDGGTPRRLTTGSHDDTPECVTRDGKWVIFRSNAFGRLDLFKVALAGGPPIRLSWDYWELEYFGSVSPDGKRIAFDLNGSPGAWRRHGHRTPNSADIWTADFTTPLSNLRRVTENTWQDFNPEWSPDSQWLYYIGSETGTPNLWRMHADGTAAKQLNFHFEDGARLMHLAADGSAAVYEYLHGIWRYDVASGETQAVPIRINADIRFNAVNEYTFAGTGVDEYALSPDGKLLALIIHGDLFVAPADGGGAARQVTSTPQREEQLTWAPDSRRLAYTGLRGATRDLFVADLRDGSEKRLTSGPGDVTGPAWGPKPDSDIAYLWNRAEIRAIAPDGSNMRTVTKGHFPDAYESGAGVIAWSPDGQWIAYSEPGKQWQGDMWVVPSAGGAPQQVAWVSKSSSAPQWAANGKFIYFSNEQSGDADPYIVDLQSRAPTFEDEKLTKLLSEYDKKPAAPAAGEPSKPGTAVTVDFARIEERLRRVTALGVSVSDLAVTPDGETMVVIATIGRAGAQLASFPTDPDKPFEFKQLTTAPGGKGGLTIDRQGRNAYFLSGGRLMRMALAGGSPAPVDFTARQTRDEFAENRAVFDEAWWTLDRMFYDPNHNGADWGAVRREYAALLPNILDKDDLYDMLLEMIHRLDASHLGVTAPARPGFGSDATGYLGVEWDWAELDRSGRYRIARVIPDGPAANPTTALKAGDYVLAVNGQDIAAGAAIDSLLNRTVGRRTTLTVAAAPGGESRTVALNPISRPAQMGLEYEAWIENCRRLVSEVSGGRVGYVHIAAMDETSLTRFKTELTTKLAGTEAAVIDVRFNGGGSTADDLLAILEVKPWVVHTYQGLPYPVSDSILRGYSYERPTACVINQWCFSNSEVFAEGFRRLGIGPVIGWPTSGSVISTGGRGLLDGGFIRTPQLGVLTADGENLEMGARKPDIPVAYDPMAILAGRDPQVERAARELLAVVDARKPTHAGR